MGSPSERWKASTRSFLASQTSRQDAWERAFIDAAVRTGVQPIVKLSAIGAERLPARIPGHRRPARDAPALTRRR